MDKQIKGFVSVRTAPAKKINGKWVPDGEFTTYPEVQNDFTPTSQYALYSVGDILDVECPMPRGGNARGVIYMKPFHRGANPVSYANTESIRNDNVIRTYDSSINWYQYVDDGQNPPYYLFHYRFDPTGSDRTVWGAGLCGGGSATLANGAPYVICTTPFASGCVQGSAEILDVLYRIEVSYTGLMNAEDPTDYYIQAMFNNQSTSRTAVSNRYVLRNFCSTPVNAPEGTPLYAFGKGALSDLPAAYNSLTTIGLYDINAQSGVCTITASELATNSIVGCHIGGTYLYTTDSAPMTYHKLLKSTDSKVQNIYSRAAISSSPYSDTPNQALGLGAVTANDNGWLPADNSLASCYRVHITSGGASGAAAYRVYKKATTQTAGNLWASFALPLSHLNTHSSSSLVITNNQFGANSDVPLTLPGAGIDPASTTVTVTSDTNVAAFRPIIKYIYPEWITANATGLVIHDLNYGYELFDSTHTFPFSPTDLTQIVHDSTGNIYAACRNTGLWKITRTPLGATTAVGLLTNASAVDDTKCYGVQVGRNDELWALMGAEMCWSDDSGTTWTVYNESTDPQFLITGHTSGGDFSFTAGIFRRDTQAAGVDQFYIPIPTALYGQEATWWSLEGSSPTSDEATLNNDTSADSGSVPLLAQVKIGFSTKGRLIRVDRRQVSTVVTQIFDYGGSVAVLDQSVSEAGGPVSTHSVNIFYRDDGVEFIMGGANVSADDYPFVLRNLDTLEVGVTTYTYNLHGDGVGRKLMRDNLSATVMVFGANGGIHIGNGIYIHTRTCTLYGSTTDLISVNTTVYGMGYESIGGELFDFPDIWHSYGWNGSAWEKDNPSSKTTHVANEDFLDGLQLGFEDTTSTASDYLTDEYYDVWMFDGILKDDSTTVNFDGAKTYVFPNIVSNTFSTTTVPATDEVWVDRPIKLNSPVFYTKRGNSTVTQADNSQTTTDWVGLTHHHEITGDFTFKFKFSDAFDPAITSTWTDTTVGGFGFIGLMTSGEMVQTGYLGADRTDCIVGVNIWHSQLDDGGVEKSFIFSENGSLVGTITTANGTGIDDEWSLIRTGTTLSLELNGVEVLSRPNVPTTAGVIGCPMKTRFYQLGDTAADETFAFFTDMKLSTTFTGRRYIHVGSNGSGHGLIEDDLFLGLCTDTPERMSLQLDGVDVVYVSDPTQPPAAGEVTMLYDGTLWFNAADAGKTISGEWIYSRHLF